MRPASLLPAGLLAAGLLVSCAGAPAGEALRGFLLVAGGAVRPDNPSVFGGFVDLTRPRERIGVLPTASAEPARSAERAFEDLRAHGARGELTVLPLAAGDGVAADDPELGARIGTLDGVWITGGSQSRVTRALRPDGRPTAALQALRDLLARGGVVGGSSAGAALMSEVMISGGRSADALRHGVRAPRDEPGVGLTTGLGLFPWGIVDQHFLARGRLGRLVVALRESGVARGWGVDEDGAFLADLEVGDVTALGPCALTLVDVSSAEAVEGGVRGVRLSLLGTGDRVHGATGRVLPRQGRWPLREGRPAGFAARASARSDPRAALEPWERDAVLRLLEQLASDPERPVRAVGEGCELVLAADERTRLLLGPDEAGPAAVDVLLSVRALPAEAGD